MRLQNSLMAILLVLFIGVAGMFYYQNFHLVGLEKKNKVTVLVAKKDIPVGTSFTTDNTGLLKVDKESVLDTYVTDFSKLEGLSAQTTVYKNEIINDKRIESDKAGKTKYNLSIKPSNQITGLEEGDTVRIFVKPRSMSQLFEVIEVKDVEKVITKVSGSGKETGIIENINLLASDAELELYERAVSVGDIVVIAYNDLSDVNRAEILSFTEAATLIEQTIEYARSNNKTKGNYFGVIHKVTQTDSWSSLSSDYTKTEESIKELNPTVKRLKAGELVRIN